MFGQALKAAKQVWVPMLSQNGCSTAAGRLPAGFAMFEAGLYVRKRARNCELLTRILRTLELGAGPGQDTRPPAWPESRQAAPGGGPAYRRSAFNGLRQRAYGGG